MKQFPQTTLQPRSRPAPVRLARPLPLVEAWQKTEQRILRRQFGSACRHEWPWFFEGRSTVSIKTVQELCRWLSQCSYVSDTELFNEPDFWQHPLAFEVTRRGDCEDHALWAWRKLAELGMHAEFVTGRLWDGQKTRKTRHAAVVFEEHAKRYLLDGTAKKDTTRMVVPFHKAREIFCPQFSVDSSFKTYRYGGALLALQAGLQDTTNGPCGLAAGRQLRSHSNLARPTRPLRSATGRPESE